VTHRPKVSIAGKEFRLPASRVARLAIGAAFIAGGALGFLPILGFWMVPVGLLVLSVDVPAVRRLRRRLAVWWARRKQRRALESRG
jgi:hypothetical protein